MASIRITRTSRYKDTPAFAGPGSPVFGVFIPPEEFIPPFFDYVTHAVRSHEVGFLDRIAVRYYGPGTEMLWWGIAQANRMIDPEREMFVGQHLVVPVRAVAASFMARSTRA